MSDSLILPGLGHFYYGKRGTGTWTLSAFPTPELLGGGRVKMIANAVKDLALDSFNWPGAAADPENRSRSAARPS